MKKVDSDPALARTKTRWLSPDHVAAYLWAPRAGVSDLLMCLEISVLLPADLDR
jgi:hypothetical protein